MVSPRRLVFLLIGSIAACSGIYTAFPCPEDGAVCPPAWRSFHGSCYVVTQRLESWADSRESCLRMGGEMMAPGSRQENDFLLSLMIERVGPSTDCWIACNDTEKEDKWACSGDDDLPTSYRNWRQNEPDDATFAHCAKMKNTGMWADNDCSGLYVAACKRHSPSKSTSHRLRAWRLLASRLVGHVMHEFPVGNIHACAVECSNMPGCLSFNVLHQGRGKTCQVNAARRFGVAQDEFIKVTGPLCIYGEK